MLILGGAACPVVAFVEQQGRIENGELVVHVIGRAVDAHGDAGNGAMSGSGIVTSQQEPGLGSLLHP